MNKLKRELIFLLGCFLVVVQISIAARKQVVKKKKATASLNVPGSKEQRAAMVAALLRRARNAHARGAAEEVRGLLFQVRRISPGFPAPAWTKQKKIPENSAKNHSVTKEKLIAALLSNPEERNIIALEEFVKQNPHDSEAREVFFRTALDSGAVRSLQRVKKAISPTQRPMPQDVEKTIPWAMAIKWIALGIGTLALIHQVYGLIKDHG